MTENLDLYAMRAVDGFLYLATPYSRFPGGIEDAFECACRCAAWLIRQGLSVYCPIAHTHPVAIHGGLDPLDHEIWMPADLPMMRAATGLVVAMMPSWEQSVGVKAEISQFQEDDKPVWWLKWPRE